MLLKSLSISCKFSDEQFVPRQWLINRELCRRSYHHPIDSQPHNHPSSHHSHTGSARIDPRVLLPPLPLPRTSQHLPANSKPAKPQCWPSPTQPPPPTPHTPSRRRPLLPNATQGREQIRREAATRRPVRHFAAPAAVPIRQLRYATESDLRQGQTAPAVAQDECSCAL